jgi:hypothetical protein
MEAVMSRRGKELISIVVFFLLMAAWAVNKLYAAMAGK